MSEEINHGFKISVTKDPLNNCLVIVIVYVKRCKQRNNREKQMLFTSSCEQWHTELSD